MFVGNVWLSIIHRLLRRHYASGKLLFTQNFTIMNNNQNENNDNVKSIHDFDFNIICEYFSCLDRQGPGSDMMTRKALNAVPAIGKGCVVADLGCGTGSQTLQLLHGTEAMVKAVDLFPLFLKKLSERSAIAGVGDRLEAIAGDMGDLPFAPASLDMIWCEGAIYNIGFQHGINLWRQYLKQNGWLVVSDAVWFTEERPEEISKFWHDAYPEIDTIANKVEQLRMAGYEEIKTMRLTDDCWTENFYEPQCEAQRRFLARYPDNATAADLIANQRHEAALFERYHEYYGYSFFIARKK